MHQLVVYPKSTDYTKDLLTEAGNPPARAFGIASGAEREQKKRENRKRFYYY